MTKQTRYVKRPCRALDSPALWDWLEGEYPELMEQFAYIFTCEIGRHFSVRRYLWEATPQYPKLREHIEKFVKCK